ncbi:hypothetical protein JTE90_013825 [Oedothorax gibbosus]|uniref:SAM domain-containing protein n=1 Tax=Oedothorax gibbosus TaxID=931172 RepID=A0AAV6VJM2_9ARAC|nr:hypothetical protein JTE90_013825 [Oedothorax gibbosus]
MQRNRATPPPRHFPRPVLLEPLSVSRRSSLVDLEVALLEEAGAMSSDSGSSPTRHAAPAADARRRSSYDNAPAAAPHQRPPSCPTVRRSTPSPSRRSGDEGGGGAPVRRRPASACGRAPRRSMPPAECHSATWGGGGAHHHGCGGGGVWCGAAPPHHQPYHWCGSPQTWGHYHHHQSNDSPYDCEELLQQRIWQLEVEKEQLTLQVNVLSEQVDAQNEKIAELESSLSRSKEQLDTSEALLRKNELILTAACLAEKEADISAFKSKLINNEGTTYDNNPELEKLKNALSSVIAVNDEKERKIQDLKSSLQRYKKLHELVLSNHSRKNNEGFSKIATHTEDNFLSALDNLASCGDINEVSALTEKPPPVPSKQLNLLSISPYNSLRLDTSFSSLRYSSSENINPPTPQKTPPSKRHYSTLPRPHQTDILKQYDTSPPTPKPTSHTLTIGSHSTHDLRRNEVRPSARSKPGTPSGSSFGRGFFRLKLGKRSSSAPQLAPDGIEESELYTPGKGIPNDRRTSSPVPPKEKVKGLRKIFGKVKRSGSDSISNSNAELKRGGIRATAGPRLGWTEELKNKRNSFKTTEPFSQWNCELLCDWLTSIGLGMYTSDCRKWGKGGKDLIQATTHDFEKELNIRSPLHRKKLLLALLDPSKCEPAGAGRLDHPWVVRWLDDIGLPQYKDNFLEGRVDGRVLNHLTLEDLHVLKVSNMLHHISVKTGIQVLRETGFDPCALQRRSLPEDENGCRDVKRWTNHRVMEWLRTVDLSEYAPNLRGSGVHGGLMMYEARFDADLLATLLNIPPSKTLLRRHLSTQFTQLVGPEVMQKKREAAAQAPLSPSAKVKSLKRSPFSLVKRKNKELDPEDYVCPLSGEGLLLLSSQQNRTEEEKFLMKEMVLKNEKILDKMPASNV